MAHQRIRTGRLKEIPDYSRESPRKSGGIQLNEKDWCTTIEARFTPRLLRIFSRTIDV